MAVLIEQRGFVAHAPEPTYDTMTRGSPFELTLASWSSNNQVDSATLTSSTISDYIGNILEFLDGNVAGELSRIRTFDGSNTITFDPLSQSSPSATRARMWVPPEPLVAATSNGSTTSIVASGRGSEANDYYNDPDRYYMVCEESGGGSIARGEAKLIGDFATSSGTFTTAAFSASSATGDLFVIRQPLKPASAELTLGDLQYTVIERKFVKGTMDQDPAVHGPRNGSFDLVLEVKGASSASSGATVAGAPTEAGDFLKSICTVDYDGSSTISGSSSSTTVLDVTDGESSRFAVGNLVMVNGEVAGITAIDASVSPDDVTVSPALSAAPAASVAVYGCANYLPKTTSFRSHTIETYLGASVRALLYGWHFDLEIEGLDQASIPRFKFSGPIDSHLRQDVAAPYTPTFETTIPRATKGSRVNLGGTNHTAVMSASFKVGYDIQPVPSINGLNGKNGHIVANRKTTGSVKIWMENANHIEEFEQVKERELLIQVGSTTTATVAIWCPAIQFTNVTVGREGGGYTVELPFNVLRSNITSVSDFCIGVF